MREPVKAKAERVGLGERRPGHDVKPARRANGTRRRAGAPVHTGQRSTPVDLGGLDGMAGYVVRRAQVWIFQDVKRALGKFDFTPALFSVLVVIGANPGLAQARVAEALYIERARLVQMLDRLEARHLIKRVRSLSDRRSYALHLTQEGSELLARLQRLVQEHERRVVARIGAAGKAKLLSALSPLLS
jgi:DNA-binding MarR family transcriptional regulator